MNILIQAAQLVLSLSILVLVHEWGHYIAAKFFKTKVEKFYLFFDPWFSLFKFKKGETEYGIGWLPLGGYVKIAGMIDESMDKEQMKLPAEPWEFRSKPAWQRLIIMLGGIIMNVILGIFIYSMVLLTWGDSYIPNSNMPFGVAVDSTAMKMGFQSGDNLVSVDGKPVHKYGDVTERIIFDNAQTVEVSRNGVIKTIPVNDDAIKAIIDAQSADFITPRMPFVIKDFGDTSRAKKAGMAKGDQVIAIDGKPTIFYDQVKEYLHSHKGKEVHIAALRGKEKMIFSFMLPSTGIIGVINETPEELFGYKTTNYQVLAAFPAGAKRAFSTLRKYVIQFKFIFSRKIQGYKHLGGFIALGKAMTPNWDWFSFWQFTAFLSIALAFMNLLPIPALDGGHVLFTLYEMITRQKPNEKFLEYAQIVGMVILLSLMLFANGNDLIKLFH